MSVNQKFEKTGSIAYLCDEYLKNNFIDPEASERLGVKRGLRNPDGTGVLAGLTNVCDVVGYDLVDGKRVPTDGRLIYRGIDVEQIVRAAYAEDRFVFEEVIWLLLFGSLPTPHQLASFKQVLEAHRELPKDFAEDMIMKAPSPNIMNKMARSVLALYSYDDNPEEQSLTNILSQSIALIASLPTIMVNAYQIKRRVYDRQSMYLHLPQPGQSTAEHILSTYRADQKFTKEEAKLLDLCLVLHADHGGGNNSTFACRVLSSSGTDTYSAISAAIGSLKGPKHGGANHKVMEMLGYIMEGVKDHSDAPLDMLPTLVGGVIGLLILYGILNLKKNGIPAWKQMDYSFHWKEHRGMYGGFIALLVGIFLIGIVKMQQEPTYTGYSDPLYGMESDTTFVSTEEYPATQTMLAKDGSCSVVVPDFFVKQDLNDGAILSCGLNDDHPYVTVMREKKVTVNDYGLTTLAKYTDYPECPALPAGY